ncbi:MAG: hypothetical protein AB1490_10125 [Pseudomonadota bacterium]
MKRICFALTAILLSSTQAVLAEPLCASSAPPSHVSSVAAVAMSARKPALACAIETRLFSRKADDGKNYTPLQACSAASGDMKLALANE